MSIEEKEAIFVKSLRCVVIIASGCLIFFLFKFMQQAGCSADSYPPSVLYAALFSIFILAFYAKFDWLSAGVVNAGVNLVRIILVVVFSAEIAWSLLLSANNSWCESFFKIGVVPFLLVIFYSIFIFANLFGDEFLGVVRNIIRFGIDPRDCR